MTDPDMQAQLEAQKANCIFCKIISGEMESKTVYKDDLLQATLDINPWVKGHVLLMPKEHYPIMPLLPPPTFRHMASMIPSLVGAVKSAMLTTGANVFIANGGIAGQQSPHFILHILPRENGDGADKFAFNEEKSVDKENFKKAAEMMKNNIPLMMKKHYQRNAVQWDPSDISRADHLKGISGNLVHEDKKILVALPEKPQCIGHLVVYSQEEQSLIENLGGESSFHLLSAASLCATAVFEGLGAQGSNIILKTGTSMDNPEGRLEIHILPRTQDDGLDILPAPLEEKPDLDDIQSRIKDKTFPMEHSQNQEGKKPEVLDLDGRDVERIGGKEGPEPEPKDDAEEIKRALERIRDSV
ncbi:MAG: HIT domain-containing protein [Candidatus Woesearchaeota archaeon]